MEGPGWLEGLRWSYRLRARVALAPWEAGEALRAERGSLVWVGHGYRLARVDSKGGGLVVLDGAPFPVEALEWASRRRVIIAYVEGEGVSAVEWRRGSGYVKLAPTRPGWPPTIEIDGIHMHRVEGVDPLTDARAKVRAARVRRGHRVLDTCAGAGYTVRASLEAGASEVVAFEASEAVLWVDERNPWSEWLGRGEVRLYHADATRAIEALPDGYFDRVIHDPPRLTGATSGLYSTEFYRQLYRVLRPGGILYHYTGNPGRLKRLNLPGRVASRLRSVGFEDVRVDPRSLGVVARKPR
ncbi:methyltransferase domain-containing protein [Stetteria hydrogenophila]